jgi:hypothetical protein
VTWQPEPRRRPSVAETLVGPVILVALALLAGWILLVTVKWLVVLLMYVLGAALIIGPFVAGARALDGVSGGDRFRRILTLAGVVCAGILLVAAARVVSHHGWVLLAVPLGVLAADRLRKRIASRS